MSDKITDESSSVDVRSIFTVGAGGKFFDILKFEAFASQNSEATILKLDL